MGADKSEQLREIGRQERNRLEAGGYLLDFAELQQRAKEIAEIDKDLEIGAFRVLETVNDRYELWRTWKAEKEKKLGRKLTAEEIKAAHAVTAHEKEDVKK